MSKTIQATPFNLLAITMSIFGILLGIPTAVSGEINIYSHRQPYLLEPFLEEFTKGTRIKTNVVFASKGLAQRLQSEGAASPADVVLTVDISRLKQYADKGLFQPYVSTALKLAIPKHLRSHEPIVLLPKWLHHTAPSEVLQTDVASHTQTRIASQKLSGDVCHEKEVSCHTMTA